MSSRRQKRGQTLALLCLTLLSVVLMGLITAALAHRAHQRMQLQTVADSTARAVVVNARDGSSWHHRCRLPFRIEVGDGRRHHHETLIHTIATDYSGIRRALLPSLRLACIYCPFAGDVP